VVIGHTGDTGEKTAAYIFLEDGPAVWGKITSLLLSFFKSDFTLCLFVPRHSRHEPLEYDNHKLASIMTCSPLERYYESGKRCHTFYMPHFTLQELLLICQFALNNSKFEDEFKKELHSPAGIECRFLMYGGMIRKVLRASSKLIAAGVSEFDEALEAAVDESSV
jgi:hypothetical protein